MTPRMRWWSVALLVLGAFTDGCGVGKEISIGVATETPRDTGGSSGAGGARFWDAGAGGVTDSGSGTGGDPVGGSTGVGGTGGGPASGGAESTPPTEEPRPYDAGPPIAKCVAGTTRQTTLCASLPDDGVGTTVEKWRTPVPVSMDRPALVANLTDDNKDGRIDTCDTPDVLVINEATQQMVLLDGATGAIERTIDTAIAPGVLPAIGDLDGDGTPEIVAIAASEGGMPTTIVALSNFGANVWSMTIGPLLGPFLPSCGAVFIRDLEGDGKAEVLVGNHVFESTGQLRFLTSTVPFTGGCRYASAADLNDDGILEVVATEANFSNKGDRWPNLNFPPEGVSVAADVIEDATPEIVRITEQSITVFRLDGTEVGWPIATNRCTPRLPVLVDFDLDNKLDIAYGPCGLNLLSPAHPEPWKKFATAFTVFDLKGTGTPVLISSKRDGNLYFQDLRPDAEETMWRSTYLDFGQPVVADVDGDGPADIVVAVRERDSTTSMMAISHESNGWVPARRIWNQAAYQVDAVNEDGKPSRPLPGAGQPNGFGVNARLENGRICTGLR